MAELSEDFDCESKIDTSKMRDGCAQFLVTVKTWVHFHAEGTQNGDGKRVFDVEGWDDDEKKQFTDRFKLHIESGWGNGAVWLAHTKKNTPYLWCDVKIEYVTQRNLAHLVVNAVNNPTLQGSGPGYSATCGSKRGDAREGGSSDPELNRVGNIIDMHIQRSAVVDAPWTRPVATSDAGTVSLKQNVLLHEFGHYLGLKHTCKGMGKNINQYCKGMTKDLAENLMAVGNKFITAHAKPFRRRLKEYHKDFLEDRHSIYWFIAKNINSPTGATGGGDRQHKPWSGTSWDLKLSTEKMA
jgi:hypothetical protein